MKKFTSIISYLLVCIIIFSLSAPMHLEAATIKLSKKSVSINAGKSKTITIKGTKKKVHWHSSDKKVATVKNGKITGKRTGTAIVTAIVSKKKYTCKVTVKPGLNKTTLTLNPNQSKKIKVLGTKKRVVWNSTRKKVATVKNGVIKAVKTGTATIKAKVDGYTLYCNVIVLPTKEALASSYRVLREKIAASPYTHTDGNKAVFSKQVITQHTELGSYEIGNTGAFLIYEDSSGHIRFEYSTNVYLPETPEESYGIRFICTLNPNTILTKKQKLEFICTMTDPETKKPLYFKASSSINVPTFDGEPHFKFTNLSSLSKEEQAYFKENMLDLFPDLYSMLAFVAWEEALKEKTNLNFKNLGFLYYDSIF